MEYAAPLKQEIVRQRGMCTIDIARTSGHFPEFRVAAMASGPRDSGDARSLFTVLDFSPMTSWSAAQYLKFEDERSRPAIDLLASVPLDRPRRVVDLGCGPGNSTELLAARFPQAEMIGIDNSPEMLVAARKRLPSWQFIEADIAAWAPAAPVHLLFANAVFQWVPDHLTVLLRLFGALAPGGVFAAQMPDNLGEPSHRLMREVAEAGPWAPRFAEPIARETLPPPAAYYDRLNPGAARIDIRHTIYNHPLENAAAIVEWVKGTGLRPYLARLHNRERAAFLGVYQERLRQAYPPLVDGRVLFRFPRLFLVAVKA
jgi:trans-aconitate 2-methyltransferase